MLRRVKLLMRCTNALTWELNRYGRQTTDDRQHTLNLSFSLAAAPLTVSADCFCSRTPGSSLAAAHCSDSCSCTPWSVRTMACHTVSADCSCSRTPGSSLVAARCSDSCSCTAWFVHALRCRTVLDDCSKLLTTGLARLCA